MMVSLLLYGYCGGMASYEQVKRKLRGLAAVRAEWRLICLSYNLLKRFRSGAMATVT